jgi:hypothetical protein
MLLNHVLCLLLIYCDRLVGYVKISIVSYVFSWSYDLLDFIMIYTYDLVAT